MAPHTTGEGHGKVILLGEHAVVYGADALVAAIPRGARAIVRAAAQPATLHVPALQFVAPLDGGAAAGSSLPEAIGLILRRLGLQQQGLQVELQLHLPVAAGLGASAAMAVATVRAAAAWRAAAAGPAHRAAAADLDAAGVAALALEAEMRVHGRASGIDSTAATYGGILAYRRPPDGVVQWRRQVAAQPLHLAVGLSHERSDTAAMVAQVQQRHAAQPAATQSTFAAIGALSRAGQQALQRGDAAALGRCMHDNHIHLQQLGVATPALDGMTQWAEKNDALGAKLCGAGGGGAMVALARDAAAASRLVAGLGRQGFVAFVTSIN